MSNQQIHHIQLRCFAEPEGRQWQAFCVDLSLAVQGESLAEVKRKLHEQVRSYVEEAYTIDREYAEQLMCRKAPVSIRFKYYRYCFRQKVAELFSKQPESRPARRRAVIASAVKRQRRGPLRPVAFVDQVPGHATC